MAQTQTIITSGSFNGPHSGGPFNIPRGTTNIQITVNITDAPPGANFRFEGFLSSDGGATWQQRSVIECPGGLVVTKQGVHQDASCSDTGGVQLDPNLTYQAKYTETSDVAVTLNASLTIF